MPRWRNWLGIVCLGLIALLTLLTVLPVVETDEWWVRLWDYPRLQIAALLAAALIGLALRRPFDRWFVLAAVAGLASLVWQLLQVAPYIPGYPKSVSATANCQPGRSLTLLNANVLMTNRDYGSLLRLVRNADADVVLLLETDREWAAQTAPLNATYPHRIGEPLANTYGIMLLSKLPLADAQVRHLLQPDVPSVRAGLRLRSGEIVDFHGLHPEPPLPGNDSGERDAELVRVGREVRAAGRAAIVMGDLNDVAWSHTSRLFRKLAGTADPRVGRGPYPTFPADWPLLSWPLDHVFVSPHFQLMEIDRLANFGSDHRPMLFRLCLVRDPDERLNSAGVPEAIREDARDQLEDGLEERAEENEPAAR